MRIPCLLLALLTTAGLHSAAAVPDAPADENAIRVTSFNIRYGTADDGENRWEKRKDLVVRTIRKLDPDLLGVQEALAFQVDELKAAFPAYEFVGAGRDDGKRGGEFAGIYYRKDRFESLAAGHVWLSETPDQPGSRGWDASLPRVATWTRLRDLRTGGPLFVINAHFDHRGPRARVESAKLMRRTIAELHDGAPVVVTGDFNATEDDEPYPALCGKAGDAVRLVDSYRALHPERAADEATFNGFSGDRVGSRIDWILHSPALRTVAAEIGYERDGDRYPSDHYPVSAVLAYGRPNRP
jgi:endonuclease/exonuclease/phosphatase family metal-dependent hydrolase